MADEICEPGKQKTRLVPQVAAERPACLVLEAFEAAAIAERLGGRHYADRRDKTLFTELIDLCLRQDFGHGHRDSGGTYIKNVLDRARGGPVGVLARPLIHAIGRIAPRSVHSPPERERDPLIGDLSGDEFAQCRTRLIVLVDEGSNDISGKLRLSVPGPGVRIPFNPARSLSRWCFRRLQAKRLGRRGGLRADRDMRRGRLATTRPSLALFL